jgi:tetratricopeptide (TPR) repeat protein
MSTYLDQAVYLRDRHRHEEAIAALHRHLAVFPDDFDGHYELAVTRHAQGGNHKTALEDIQRAIGLDPEAPHAHALRSSILDSLERHDEALAAADEALRLDAEYPFAWFCKGHALLGKHRLAEAEQAARQALALDPEHSGSSNLLATVLRLQKRFDDAQVEIDRHLARDPENAWTFATSGWTALHQGDVKRAEQLFRESLRLDPEMEHARIGLREAYKGRSFLYRLFLRWVFFLQRYSEKNRWLVIIGLYLAYRFGSALLSAIHPLAAVPLIIAYLLLCFGTWLASGLGHFLLLKDPLVRLTLNAEEKRDGLLVGGLFFGGAIVLIAGLTVLPFGIAFLGGAMMAAAVPGSMVFDNPSTKGRLLFTAITLTVLACGTAIALRAKGDSPLDDISRQFLLVGALATMATTWIGGVKALRHTPPQ